MTDPLIPVSQPRETCYITECIDRQPAITIKSIPDFQDKNWSKFSDL